MRKTINTIIRCLAVCCGVMLIIHRRVIAAAITGDPMPEPPEWHKKFLKCCMEDEKADDKEAEIKVEAEDEPEEEDEEDAED